LRADGLGTGGLLLSDILSGGSLSRYGVGPRRASLSAGEPRRSLIDCAESGLRLLLSARLTGCSLL
jgi:hypothetical protein